MKNIRNTLMCAGLLLASVLGINSCRKPSVEGDVVRFSASTFSRPLTKTAYSGVQSGGKERIDWISTDLITIACAQCGTPSSKKADYRVANISDSGLNSEANIIPVEGNGLTWGTGTHYFYAVYPGNNTSKIQVGNTGTVTATFQASQGVSSTSSSTSGGVTTTTMAPDMSNAFMYASQSAGVGSTVSLEFKPMFTALQFTVIGDASSAKTLSTVELSSASCALSGPFVYSLSAGNYTSCPPHSDTNEKITYNFPNDTKISSSKQVCFTLFVPATKSTTEHNISGLTIRFKLSDNSTRALRLKNTSGTFYSFEGGKKYIIPTMTLPSTLETDFLFDVLSVEEPTSETSERVVGFFSVANNKKVVFSPGNLQAYFATAGNTFTWRFAERQWDYVGNAAANTSISGNGTVNAPGTVDLFCWSSVKTNYGIHNSTGNKEVYNGNFRDWGGAVATTLGVGWHTMTYREWDYLLSTRPTPYRFCLATVHGVKGLVLFPDRYTPPISKSFDYLNTAGDSNTCSKNNLSNDEWTTLESAGCVFLPMAGKREGTAVSSVNGAGSYWADHPSSESAGDISEHDLFFNQMGSVTQFGEDPVYWGLSVRLVKAI